MCRIGWWAQMSEEVLEKLQLEVRRGALVLAVLAQLHGEHYGYSLRKSLAASGISIEEGTLYPLLRRLEKQGLLDSEWREEGKRNKRFYRLSAAGKAVLAALRKDWDDLNVGIQNILEGGT